MKRPSFFVRALVALTSAFFVLSFLLMQQFIASLCAFILFFFLWALLQVAGRDPNINDAKARLYFRLAILSGTLIMLAALLFSLMGLINGQYKDAARSFGVFVMFSVFAWRYRKACFRWFRKDET